MEPFVDSGMLLRLAKSPLSSEAELRALLQAAPLSGVGWPTVRLLVSSARCTLAAGRGDLAAPLISAALSHSPPPFAQLAALRDDTADCCACRASLLPVADDVSGVVCTALLVWHGAITSHSASSEEAMGVLRFSHRIGHILSQLATNPATRAALSECWLYNLLSVALRRRWEEAVARFLLDETDGSHLCVSSGLGGTRVAPLWRRLCAVLYANGAQTVRAALADISRCAAAAVETLRRAFDAAPVSYPSDLRRPPKLDAADLARLRAAAETEEMGVSADVFAPWRLASRLSAAAVSSPPPSAAAAMALRHGHEDAAAELLRAAPNDGDAMSAAVLRLLDGARGPLVACSVRAAEGEPMPLLHEAVALYSDAAILHSLGRAHALRELLPAGALLLRGGRPLLGNVLAAPIVLRGLARLVGALAETGDASLAQCFLPLIAGICARGPSRVGLHFTLQSIAAVAKCCAGAAEEWREIAAALAPFLPPPSPSPSLSLAAWRQGNARRRMPGRIFAARQAFFSHLTSESDEGDFGGSDTSSHDELGDKWREANQTKKRRRRRRRKREEEEEEEGRRRSEPDPALPWHAGYCQLHILLRGADVRLVRCGDMTWERSLPIAADLLALLPQMVHIEERNRRQLRASASTADRAVWWTERRALDAAVGEVVAAMESERLFGPSRAALCGALSPSCVWRLRGVADRLLAAMSASTVRGADVTLLFAALPLTMALPNVRYAGDAHCDACDAVLAAALEEMGRAWTALWGEWPPTDALRAALRAVLETLRAEMGGDGHADLRRLRRAPPHVLLDDALHALPWEGMDVLRAAVRAPTGCFAQTAPRRTLDGRFFAVLDPAGDMPRSARRLRPLCEARGGRVTRGALTNGVLREMYACGADVYVYVGHGRGEQELPRGALCERLPDPMRFPVAMLMGCSSARVDGAWEGMPHAFLHAGAPAVIGCLWHVTDGEIDRVTRHLLRCVAGEKGAETLAEALVLAREKCRLPFLTGCATVMYGVNVTLRAEGKEDAMEEQRPSATLSQA